MSIATTTITIDLPITVYERLQQVTRQQSRSVPEIVRDIVLRDMPASPPLPHDFEAELNAFERLSDDVLWLIARSALTKADQRAFSRLNRLTQERSLTAHEQIRQQALMDSYDHALVRRAHAAAILKMRGHDLTDLEALQPS